ncbi:uncharacterized protein BYT42DRAFT_341921 [Radiomyces spectabilis]|uniref:uncharacterized protein n=1 Tax=Radiomyces spectabilis TaxID=64574 RepID=UPI00222075B1|nr:uncharacterized protein BYT42DRAFT_341921 [Radiomyces spectabilis]KAI8377387.1 hypothetical protein BYT42DRAFT_341921 [Radiomyces spectabilis]
MSETVVTVVAHHPYEAQRDDELAFEKGDVIQVVNKSDPDWWVGKKDNGDSGFFPSNFVEIVNEKDAATDNEKPVDTNNQHQDADASETAQEEKEDEQEKAPANVPIGMARVMEDYAMQEPDELTLHRGGIVTLFERTDSWMRGELNGKTGRFPAKYVEDIDMPGRPDLGQGGPMYGQKEATEEARPAFRLASFGVKQGGIGSLLAGGFPTLKKTGSAGKVPTEKSEKHVVEPQPSSEDAAAASSELESRPSSVVSGQQKEEEKQSEAASATVLGKAMVLHPYDAENEDELTLLRGEYIQITNRHADEGWWEGVNEKGQRGIFPANFVKELEEEKAAPAPPVRSRKSVASVGSQQSMASPSLTGGFRLPPLPTSRPSSAASNVTAEKPPLPETPKQRAPPVTEESAVSEGSEGQSEEQSSAPASSYRVPSTNDEPAQVEETTGPSLSEPKIEEKPATENVTEAAEVSAKTPEEAIKSPEEEFDTVTSATPLVDLNEHAVSAAEESQSVKPTEETKENDNVEDANKSIQASLEPVSEKKLPSEAPVPVPVPEQPAKPIETETAPVKESPKTSPIETSTNEKEPAEVATEVKPSTDEPEPEPAAAVKEAQTSEDEKKDNEPEAQAEKDKPEQREEAIPAITESNEASEEHPTSEALPSGPRLSAPSRARPGARPRRSPQGSPSGNSKHELSQMELLQQDLAQSPSEETPKESPVSDVSSEKSTSTSPPAKPVKPIFAKFPTPFAVNKDDIANKTLKPVQRRIWEPAPAHEPKEEKKSEQQEAPRPSGVKNIASRFNFGGVPSGGSNEVLETKLKNFSKNEVEKTRKEFQQLLEEERAQRLQLEELVKTLAAKIEHLESQLSQQ